MKVLLKRIYEPTKASDGQRVLVDRLWPRGISKERAKLKLWLKEIAPSTELRKWFNHDPKKWPEFQKRYKQELRNNRYAVNQLKSLAKKQTVTLLYGARDEEHNEALVIQQFITK